MKKAAAVFLGLVFILSAIAGGFHIRKIYKQEKEKEDLLRREEEFARQRQEPETWNGEAGEIPVDFGRLQEKNSDIYAWITIPGTQVDDPILQNTEDNTYYLTHSADKEKNEIGSVFTENYNRKDFEGPITVVYGPNSEDGSMFGGLRQYEDNLYMNEHKYIYIYTPEHIYKYCIFAAYLSDDVHLMLRFNSGATEGSRQAYLDSILDTRLMGAQIDRTAPVDADSNILTLSTHDAAGDAYRYLVQAYLTDEIF